MRPPHPDDEPDWDSFEPYKGPERPSGLSPSAERMLHRLMLVLVSIVVFVAGGIFGVVYPVLFRMSDSHAFVDERAMVVRFFSFGTIILLAGILRYRAKK